MARDDRLDYKSDVDPHVGFFTAGQPLPLPIGMRIDIFNDQTTPGSGEPFGVTVTLNLRNGETVAVLFPPGGVGSFMGKAVGSVKCDLTGVVWAITYPGAPASFPSAMNPVQVPTVATAVPAGLGSAAFGPTIIPAATVETTEATATVSAIGLVRFTLARGPGTVAADLSANMYVAIKGATSGTYYAVVAGQSSGTFRLTLLENLLLVVRNAGANAYIMAGALTTEAA